MTLTGSLPTEAAAGLSINDWRAIQKGLVVRDAAGVPRLGVIPAGVGSLVTGTAGMAYSVAAFVAATARNANGVEWVANDGAVSVTTTAAPASNSRIDVIWVKPQFNLYGDTGLFAPVFGVTQGTAAASPLKPTIPAGALELATATIPSTATTTLSGGVVITQTYLYTALAGGSLVFRNSAEQSAWVPTEGQVAYRLDVQREYTYLGATIGWFHSGGKVETAAISYTGIYSAGSPAPRLVHNQGRIHLEGFLASSSASFVVPNYYTFGSIPVAFAPLTFHQFPVYLNAVLGFVTVDTGGNLALFTTVNFTGPLQLYLDSVSWTHKLLG
jgi:hypothetical protein